MGNHVAFGHAANCCQDGAEFMGCGESVKFEHTATAVMEYNGIQSWNAKAMVKGMLEKQKELANRSPLRLIPVEDGLSYVKRRLEQVGVMSRGLAIFTCTRGFHMTRDQFVQICWDMMKELTDYQNGMIRRTPKDRDDLFLIFDSMDIDGSGILTTGEWAGGCSVFFRGTTEECIKAVFEVLDQDESGTLTKSELREYLKPFLKAMIPEQASALQPMLLKEATDKIFKDVDKDHNESISAEELLKWSRSGGNIIDALSSLIDEKVYSLWMQSQKKRERQAYNSWGAGRSGPQTQLPAAAGPPVGQRPGPLDSQKLPGQTLGSAGPDPRHAGSVDHFESTASHWKAIPPPPPPPNRSGGLEGACGVIHSPLSGTGPVARGGPPSYGAPLGTQTGFAGSPGGSFQPPLGLGGGHIGSPAMHTHVFQPPTPQYNQPGFMGPAGGPQLGFPRYGAGGF